MAFTINNAQEMTLIPQGFNASGGGVPVTSYVKSWHSDNPSVVVTGVAPDGVQVAASVPGATGTATITLDVTRTDGSHATAVEVVNVIAAPPPLPATVAIASGGPARPRTFA